MSKDLDHFRWNFNFYFFLLKNITVFIIGTNCIFYIFFVLQKVYASGFQDKHDAVIRVLSFKSPLLSVTTQNSARKTEFARNGLIVRYFRIYGKYQKKPV